MKKKPSPTPNKSNFPIVAIGASAGGLEAIETFLRHLPVDTESAFVIIQHLDPTQKCMLPELLQRVTSMPVAQAKNCMQVELGCIYVIPPNHDLSITDDILYLVDPIEPRGLRLPIDYFFRALAYARRDQAVAMVFSGMGSDGALGIKAIKENGGLVLVQEPASAKFDSMPRSAIETGLVDYIAPVKDLAKRLPVLIRQPHFGSLPPSEGKFETNAEKSAFEKICTLISVETGHDFSQYKKSTVYRRIERRMTIHEIKGIENYVLFLKENKQEIHFLFKELLIGVTDFFRDIKYWDYLKEHAVPELLKTAPKGATLRAWVAGCSSGEEAYSLAISFIAAQEKLGLRDKYSLQIFATDIDQDAIEKARQGLYPNSIVNDLSEDQIERFFTEEDGRFRVKSEIREMVVFATQNLIKDPPFIKLDILTCRNLLIYFGPALQKKLLPLFHYSLNHNGILMLGNSENIGNYSNLFTPLNENLRIFKRTSLPSRAPDIDFPSSHPAFKNEISMVQELKYIPEKLQILADRLLLEHFSPPAVIVTRDGDVVYINGRTGKYLEPPSGKANWNIYAMAREGLRQEISIGLPKALREEVNYERKNIIVGTSNHDESIDLIIHPIDKPKSLSGMAVVFFKEVNTAKARVNTESTDGKSSTIDELKNALEESHEELRALRKEMQDSQEEIKSSNEELQSTNEELQSTNEELTTSKEEMQSLNEELQTVNSELRSKVEELSSINNDMKNLLDSTDLAIVFLNNALQIRRFTSKARSIFKLIDGDIGRRLSDIVTILDYPDLMQDAEEVLRTLTFSDREIKANKDSWYQVKIMPYRTLENFIDGVVITVNNISRAKKLEAELRELIDGNSKNNNRGKTH